MELLEVAGGSAALYVLIIICLRLIGKKGLAEISLGDLVLIILIGEALGSIIPQENAFISAVVCIISLTIMNYLILNVAYRFKLIRDFLEGSPVIIVKNGRILHKKMKEEKLTQDDLDEALREKGVKDVKSVETAVLETDGDINIVEK